MKPSIFRLGLGIGCVGLGAATYWHVYGYSFAGVLIAAIGLLILMVEGLIRLRPRAPRLCGGLLAAVGIACGAGIIAAAVTEGFLLAGARTSENSKSEYVIVLGAGVNGTEPSRSLRERLDGAAAYLKQYPQSVCVVSGGQGSGEDITEAQCMFDGLVERGIAPERIWKEEQATDTCENIRFSLELLRQRTGSTPKQVTVITSEYHLLRAKRECESHGAQVKGFACRTENMLFRIQSYLREIPAVWVQLLRP